MNKDDFACSIIRNLWRLVRGPFLILTPIFVLLGATVAYTAQGSIDGFKLMLILSAALLAHISVNLFNEHHDFQSGLDALTAKTPFNGGSGVLIKQPQLAPLALMLAWFTLIISVLIGCYLIVITGWALVPLGLVGVVLVYGYTGWLTRHPLMCLLSPGLGFGYIMVLGSYFVLAGEYSLASFFVATFSAGLVSGLLLINQIPDKHADQQVGRRTLPIVYGLATTVNIYGLLMAGSLFMIVLAVIRQVLPMSALISLLITPLVIYVFVLLKQRQLDQVKPNKDLIQILTLNTLISVMTPVLLTVGLIWS